MKPNPLFVSAPCLLAILLLAGCGGHTPLPRLEYRPAPPMGAPAPAESRPTPSSVEFVPGRAIGHSLTTYALMPGGYALPISSGPSPKQAFNTDDQAAFVENLARVLTERKVIELVAPETEPPANITVKFLKTEHFPDMQDYALDALVKASSGDRHYERVHQVNTMESANLVSRMFQNAIDGRRRAAELLLASVVPDLENFFAQSGPVSNGNNEMMIPLPFDPGAVEVLRFLAERYARPSTFWKDGINVRAVRPIDNVLVIELRWSHTNGLPPFGRVNLYAADSGMRAQISEHNAVLFTRARVREALQDFINQIPRTN